MLSGLFERRKLDGAVAPGLLEDLSSTLSSTSLSGMTVTANKALQAGAVQACVRVLSDSIAMLPLVVYERQNGGVKRKAFNHYLYPILHDAPNPEMTAFNFRQTLMGHLALRGNAYCYIETDNRGRVSGLWPINPDDVVMLRDNVNYELFYGIRLPERFGREYRILPAEKIWHLRGLGSDGLVGYSPIKLAREAIGLAIATEGYGSAFFGNGAEPGFVLIHPGKLGDEAYKRLRDSWENRHKGYEQAHRVAILEEGMKPEKLGISNDDAQFLETRKYQVTDIARIFRVPPHMIADLERATFSNIEHMGIEFVTYSLMPWLVNIEQSISQNLMLEKERGKFYAKHVVQGLLRGDAESRYQGYAIGRQWGWLSVNDIRELEEMNPVQGGDDYLTPLNMMVVNQGEVQRAIEVRQEALEDEPVRDLTARRRLIALYEPLLLAEIQKIFRREGQDLMKLARKMLRELSIQEFIELLSEFYRNHNEFVRRMMGRVMGVYANLAGSAAADEVGGEADERAVDSWTDRYVEAYASREEYDSRERIERVLRQAQEEGLQGDEIVEALSEEVGTWPEVRAQSVARREAVRLNNGVATMIFSALGVRYLVWRTFDESCPYCNSLNGKRVGVTSYFLSDGDVIHPEGSEPLVSRQNHRHPPIHGGCDCMVTAG